MELNSYQQRSGETQLQQCNTTEYLFLGLMSEIGETAGKYKKILRDKNGYVSDEDRVALRGEMGDILWYWARLCAAFNIDANQAAEENLVKLNSRKQRGVIGGSGDNR